MVRVHQLYNSTIIPISALVKRPLNQSFDTWIAILTPPADPGSDLSVTINRSPTNKKRWPTVHQIVIWNGSSVNIERSLRIADEGTPPGKEEDAKIGINEGWNTYVNRRFDRRGRSNSQRSRTLSESEGSSEKNDSSMSDRFKGKRKNGSQ